jgi:aspartyl-tRNA(Asn)/glutamyl-tRNA(Gln) amidotransferase subunit A
MADLSRRRALQMAGGAVMAAGCASDPEREDASARARVEAALARIADPAGEGARTCLTVYAESARAAADAADRRAKAGASLGPMDGVIVSLKDLFDVAGETTRAGSTALADEPPAIADAPVVQRLKAAGAVIIAKTNMTEFAFSGLGANPHYGTPGNPADRARVPGGSSSGAGAAVAYDFCEVAIGTDTGGSARIPAAMCGVVGFKPSRSRVPTDGAFPLSQTLDSIGPLARTVADCAKADAVMAGEAPWAIAATTVRGLKLGVAQGLPLRDLDATVSARFDAATQALAKAGVDLSEETFALFDDMAQVNATGSIVTIEAWFNHRARIAARGADYDPFVRARIETARNVTEAELAAKLAARADIVKAMDSRLAGLDAVIMPTTPIVAPLMSEIATLEGWTAKNGLMLRNTAIANFFDLCAVSLPIPRGGGLNAGLMIVARNGQDRQLLAMAEGIERALAA